MMKEKNTNPGNRKNRSVNRWLVVTKAAYVIIALVWLGANSVELAESWPHFTGRLVFHTVLALLVLVATVIGLWYELHTRPRRLVKDVNRNQIP